MSSWVKLWYSLRSKMSTLFWCSARPDRGHSSVSWDLSRTESFCEKQQLANKCAKHKSCSKITRPQLKRCQMWFHKVAVFFFARYLFEKIEKGKPHKEENPQTCGNSTDVWAKRREPREVTEVILTSGRLITRICSPFSSQFHLVFLALCLHFCSALFFPHATVALRVFLILNLFQSGVTSTYCCPHGQLIRCWSLGKLPAHAAVSPVMRGEGQIWVIRTVLS